LHPNELFLMRKGKWGDFIWDASHPKRVFLDRQV